LLVLVSLIFAAGIAVQPLPPATEADMRCFASMLYALGTTEDAGERQRLLSSVSFYVGRLDRQVPSSEWSGHIERIGNDPNFLRTLDREIERCASESGKVISAAAKAASQAADNIQQ
jgi:hypothetical protein